MSDQTASTRSAFQAEPRRRNALRMFLGKTYFTFRRHLVWRLNRQAYATSLRPGHDLPHCAASHKTPLIRPLGADSMPLQHNKITNLKLALPRINGLILNPGETFSFWRLVGKPTRRQGDVDGMILHNGTFSPGIGGGLCQLSNLIYWMTVHTALTVTERWRHNYDVFPDAERTQPFGSGATVVYNYVDLQIVNNTAGRYQLKLWLDDTHLHGSWLADNAPECRYEVYESEHLIQSQWWGGYTRRNVLKRKVYDPAGHLTDDEFVCRNEAIMMYEPLLPS